MLNVIVSLIARLAPILYFFAGLGGLWALRNFSLGSRLKRSAVYSLEKEQARNLRRRGVSMFFSMALLAGSVYLLANVIQPMLEGLPPIFARPQQDEAIAPLPTPIGTPTARPLLFPTVTPTFALGAQELLDPEVLPSGNQATESCDDLAGVNISSPLPGEVVAGQVEVRGVANIIQFAGYKLELRGPFTGDAWVPVGNFDTPVASGFLGSWDATSFPSGQYFFRLVVFTEAETFPSPCVIPITIASPVGAGGEEQTVP